MREFLVLLVLLPVALVVVLNQELATLQASAPQPTPIVIHVAVPTPTVAPAPSFAGDLVSVARSWLNPPVPYAWGGCSRRGVDCSCFVQLVYAAVGIQVPRTTVTQVAFDRPVSRADLRPGDTLFFNDTCDHATCGANPTHEGLYIGAGLMVEAGDPVQIASIDAPFWRTHYASAGRPPGP